MPAPPARPRHRRLEADDTAAGPHNPTQLPEASGQVRQRPEPKGDRRGVEAGILEGQGEGVAEQEFELDEVAGVRGSALDHSWGQVDGHDAPERPDPIGQDRGQLARPSGDVDRRVARPDAGRLDDGIPPPSLEAEREDRPEPIVDRGNLVEDRGNGGRRGGIAPLGRVAGRWLVPR